MVLHYDIHGICDSIATPPLHIPNQQIVGACTDDTQPTQSQVEESLISLLNSTHTVNWEQVQTATSSDNGMLLLLSANEDGTPEYQRLPSISKTPL